MRKVFEDENAKEVRNLCNLRWRDEKGVGAEGDEEDVVEVDSDDDDVVVVGVRRSKVWIRKSTPPVQKKNEKKKKVADECAEKPAQHSAIGWSVRTNSSYAFFCAPFFSLQSHHLHDPDFLTFFLFLLTRIRTQS